MRRFAVALCACMMIVLSLATVVSAQPITFGHSFGGSGNEFGTAIATDPDGNVYVVGETSGPSSAPKGLLTKFDSNGEFVWGRTLTSQYTDMCTLIDVAVTSSGTIYVVGHTNPTVFVAKFGYLGDLLWSRGLSNVSSPTAIAVNPVTGGVVIGANFGEFYAGAVVALNPDGSWKWMRYNSDYTAYPYGVAVDQDGNTFAFYDRNTNVYNVGFVKFDGAGNILGETMLDTALDSEYTWDLALDPSGDLVASGAHWGDGQKALVAKMDRSLKPIWTEYISKPGYSLDGYRVGAPQDGSIYLMCWTNSDYTAMFHLDSSGALLSGTIQTIVSDRGILQSSDIVARQGGGLLICGTSFGAPQGTDQELGDVVVEPANGTWTTENLIWTSERVWLDADPVSMFGALPPVDDFGADMEYQMWWGAIDLPASGIIVEINSTQLNNYTYSFTTDIYNGTGPYSYHWTFGDGAMSNLSAPSHVFRAAGEWWVQVEVTDSLGARAYASTHVFISGPPQIVDFIVYPQNATVGQSVYFQVDAYDPDGGTMDYYWDFGDNNSQYTMDPWTSHAYQWPGAFPASVQVTDDDGDVGFASSWVYVTQGYNEPPIAYFNYYPYDPASGSPVTFDAYYSYDPDGWIVAYQWLFGDGSWTTGMVVNHTYQYDGDYIVTLTVTDNEGAFSNYSVQIHVEQNMAPVADFTWYPEKPAPYDYVVFNSYGSYDPDGWISYYYWDFGDGTSQYTTWNYSVHHYYSQGGSYNVTLTVVDNQGASGSATKVLEVDLPPVAVIDAPAVGKVGTEVHFSAAASYDPDGNITECYWSFGDGESWVEGLEVGHVYASPGPYEVRLEVIDNSGSWSETEVSITILEPKPPVAVIGYAPYPIVIGAECVFDASASVDPDGSISTCIWQFGDGSVANGTQAGHIYRYAGQYQVRLVVIDEDGLSAETTVTVTVMSSKPRTTDLSPGMVLSGSPVAAFGGFLGVVLGAVAAIGAVTLFRYVRRSR